MENNIESILKSNRFSELINGDWKLYWDDLNESYTVAPSSDGFVTKDDIFKFENNLQMATYFLCNL